MDRREFLKYSAYIAMAIQAGALVTQAKASPPKKRINGQIIAACGNTIRTGDFSHKNYGTVLSSFNLDTGIATQIPIKMEFAHDALKIGENFLIIPNGGRSNLRLTDLDGRGQNIELPINIATSGHGFFDKENNTIVLSARDRKYNNKNCFVVIDPQNYKILDTVHSNGVNGHDIQLYNKDTFAVCNYNGYADKERDQSGYAMVNHDGFSDISLYDRKTFELKDRLKAYQKGMVSHSVVTQTGDIFAIGFQEYDDQNIDNWDAQYIEEKFKTYFSTNHPELLSQWQKIANNATIHRVEKSKKTFGLPLLPLRANPNETQMNVIPINNYNHRRAQSICYIEKTNTVCMSYPNSDSVMLYNASTDQARHLQGAELGLKEMRGICEIEDTPYLAIAGNRRGIAILDTRDLSIIQNYDVSMGRIIHMHHIA